MEKPRPPRSASLQAHSVPPAVPESLSLPAAHALRAVVSPTVPTPLGLQGTHNRTFKHPNCVDIGQRWRDIQGGHDWDGLLEPLDECLRLELIRYGQFAQVAYDAFDFDKFSQYCGSCRYSKDNLFKGVDLHQSGYTVTMYIYATADVEVPYLLKKSEREDAWSSKSNWIGYVAVCTDEAEVKRLGRRDIVIAWRGTVTGLEWAANLKFNLIPCGLTDESEHGQATKIEVEEGFLSLYTAAKEDSRFNKISAQSYLVKEIRDLIDKYQGPNCELSITVCGHSLGSALAILSAYDLAESDLNQVDVVDVGGKRTVKQIPITVFSFAGPRVGNRAFKKRLKELGVKVLRVVNKKDVVPHVPGWHILEEIMSSAYTHVGKLLTLDDTDSKHLNHSKAAVWSFEHFLDLTHDFGALALHHNLEVYLHLIDGYGRYGAAPSRDLVLVNKSTGFLKDDKYVPEAWWQPKHKGLEYSLKENRYYQPDRAVDDIPVPPKPETVNAAKAFTKILSLRKSLEKNKAHNPEKHEAQATLEKLEAQATLEKLEAQATPEKHEAQTTPEKHEVHTMEKISEKSNLAQNSEKSKDHEKSNLGPVKSNDPGKSKTR